MSLDLFVGFCCGFGAAMLVANWLSAKEHRDTLAILGGHFEWLRKQVEAQDGADWWKDDGEGRPPRDG